MKVFKPLLVWKHTQKTYYEGADAHIAKIKKCPDGLKNEILLYKWGMEIISYFIHFYDCLSQKRNFISDSQYVETQIEYFFH